MATASISVLGLGGCLESDGDNNDMDAKNRDVVHSYTATVTDTGAEGQLSLAVDVIRQLGATEPGVIRFEMENRADDVSTYWPFHGSVGEGETPFNGTFVEHDDGETSLYLRDHDPEDGADDGNFERIEECWYANSPPDGDPKVTLDGGENHVRYAGIAGAQRSAPEDEPDTQCFEAGRFSTTQTVYAFDGEVDHPKQENAADEITLSLALELTSGK